MAEKLVEVFVSPKGVDNVSDPKGAVFQPPTQGRPDNPFLKVADNVDAYRDQRYKTRQGRTKVRTLTRGHSGWACSLGAFYVDEGVLYQFVPGGADVPIQSGLDLNRELSYAEVEGQVFWSNGAQVGRVVGGAAQPWGLRIADPPGLAATTGSLLPGSYMVAVAPAVGGLESGVRQAARITLNKSGGIAVTLPSIDPQATEIAVFCSDVNGSELFYHSSRPVADFVIGAPPQTTDLFDGLGGHAPPAGHLVRRWGGFLIVATDDGLYFSEPGNPHRFHIDTDTQLVSSRPVMLEPVVDGFYFALEGGGTFFAQGVDLYEMKVRQLDDRLVSEQRNSLRVPASKLPWLQSDLDVLVPIWATQEGWACGLPGGVVRYPVGGRVAMDAARRSTGAYVERPGLKQLMLSMRATQQQSTLKFADAAVATVTRGGVIVE